jgi:hypothetical protein
MKSWMMKIFSGAPAVLLLVSALSGCAKARTVTPIWSNGGNSSESRETAAGRDDRSEVRHEKSSIDRDRAELRKKLKASPRLASAATSASALIRSAALADRKLRIIVSTRERALWLMSDTTVLQMAPIAVGMHESFTWAGKTYDFKTPHSLRRVISKGTDPLWVPPDWHYFEKAAADKLEPVHLKPKQVYRLADSTRIEVRGDQVGRVNRGNWWAFEPGAEIIFEGKIFIPPMGSAQRRVPEVLGTHKLEIGDGYLIHGTNTETSVGEAVSHGCVRMYNEDVAKLFAAVPVGTPVYIF